MGLFRVAWLDAADKEIKLNPALFFQGFNYTRKMVQLRMPVFSLE